MSEILNKLELGKVYELHLGCVVLTVKKTHNGVMTNCGFYDKKFETLTSNEQRRVLNELQDILN